jgi:hypothetical protein
MFFLLLKRNRGRGGGVADRWWEAALPGMAATRKWGNRERGPRGGRGRPIHFLTSDWDGLWKEIAATFNKGGTGGGGGELGKEREDAGLAWG